MLSEGPNFSPFPFAALRRVSRADAAIETSIARWLAAATTAAVTPRALTFTKTAALVGGPVSMRLLGVRPPVIDLHAAIVELRIAGASIHVALPSAPVRAVAQRLLGGPPELPAPRPLTSVEQAIAALLVSAALEDLQIAGEVWPLAALPPLPPTPAAVLASAPTVPARVAGVAPTVAASPSAGARARAAAREPSARPGAARVGVEVLVTLAGTPLTLTALLLPSFALALPPPRPLPAWAFAIPVVVGRCAIHREDLARLAVRDIITVERCLELSVGCGALGLSAAPGAIEAAVATGYVARDMALPDDAHLELTVQLGTTQLSLRQLADLVPGAIIPLGRPLAGPYEVHAGGRRVGHGELVDVDGELGVRIVSLQEQ